MKEKPVVIEISLERLKEEGEFSFSVLNPIRVLDARTFKESILIVVLTQEVDPKNLKVVSKKFTLTRYVYPYEFDYDKNQIFVGYYNYSGIDLCLVTLEANI